MASHIALHALAFCLLLLSAGASASPPPAFSDDYPCVFDIASQGTLPADSILYVQYEGAGGNRSTAIVAREGNRATLYSDSAAINAALTYDDYATPSPDGIWEGAARCNGISQPIPMRFIGSLAGTLFSQNGSVIGGAFVEMSCSGGERMEAQTSEAGAFQFAKVPEGECIISSKYGEESAQLGVGISRGGFQRADVTLARPDKTLLYSAVAAFVIAIALAAYFFRGKGGAAGARQKREKAPPAKPPNVADRRQLDLLATLDAKEKTIVEYVQHHAPASVRVSRMRRDLLIPKTSLTRTLAALERKQFLKIEKIGSRQFAALHGFYRGQ
ncbi:MAG: hypothetical protein WC717_06355 [Candidatus Micrarchaeia archaeon]